MWKLFEAQCMSCGKIQEQWINTKDDKTEPCKECKGTDFKAVCSTGTHGQHVSWSKWRVKT